MNITAETFLQIIKSLRSDSSNGQTREQRKTPRVGVRGRSTITIPSKSGSKQHPVTVRDLSVNGIGMLMVEPLVAVGEEFVLMLPSGGQQDKRQMLCKVTRFNKLSPNLYSVGASFLHELNGSKPATQGKKSGAPAQQISQEMLDQADSAAVHEVEERLKRLSA